MLKRMTGYFSSVLKVLEGNGIKKFKYYILGVVTGICLTGGTVLVMAETMNIPAEFLPLKFYFFGEQKTPPEDQKGFIYNGRTFVSIRFISESLNIPIRWEDSTKSIYVGESLNEKKIKETISFDKISPDSESFYNWEKVNEYIGINGLKYNLAYCFKYNEEWDSPGEGSFMIYKYNLGGKYVHFNAEIIPSEAWNKREENQNIGNFKIYCDGKLRYDSGNISSKQKEPLKIDMDLSGVINFEINGAGNDLGFVNAVFSK